VIAIVVLVMIIRYSIIR